MIKNYVGFYSLGTDMLNRAESIANFIKHYYTDVHAVIRNHPKLGYVLQIISSYTTDDHDKVKHIVKNNYDQIIRDVEDTLQYSVKQTGFKVF